jgi:succinyl-diaminopimelate desuccinylase
MAPQAQRFLSAVDEDRAIEAVQGALRISSVFGNEEEVGEFFLELMRSEGIDDVELHEVEESRNNVVGTLKGTGDGPTLVLQGHIDTVPPGRHPEPFSGALRDGRIWGRGASDMKGPVVAAVLAVGLANRIAGPLKGTCVLAATVVEVSEKRGMFELVDSGLDADFGINVEPTDLRVAIAQKGCVSLRVTTQGKAAHGANPHLGNNAIHTMAQVVSAIQNADLPRREIPGIGEVQGTYNVGVIQGGEMFFIVPDACSIWVDRRTIPGETQHDALDGLVKLLAEEGVEAEVVVDRQDWKWDRIRNRGIGSSSVDPDSQVVRSVCSGVREELGLEPEYHLQTAWCETDFLSNDLGIPTVNFGPGKMELAHTSDEHIEVESLTNGIAVLAYAIADICG